jgi:hypothetical protein
MVLVAVQRVSNKQRVGLDVTDEGEWVDGQWRMIVDGECGCAEGE